MQSYDKIKDFTGKGKELENMDVKEIVGKVVKGVCSLVLILLLMRGFEFGFSSNWLLSIGIILGGTLFLYLWGAARYWQIFMEKKIAYNRSNSYRLFICSYA